MKKLLCLLCLAVLIAATAGCSSQKSSPTVMPTEASAETAVQSPTEAPTELPTEAETVPAPTHGRDTIYEYETREIWCENNGNRIFGVAYVPVIEGQTRFPLVLHAHGLGSNHESGDPYCKAYAEHGFAAYTFDFPGGSRPGRENKSDGDTKQMSPVTEASDMQAVLDSALGWDFTDPDYIFLEGGSQGGLVATMVALDNNERVRGMILHYPALYMPQLINSGYSSYEEIPDESPFSEYYYLSGKFARDLWGVDVISRLSEFDGSVLIIHGSEDGIVSPEGSREAAELFKDGEFVIIDGAGHGFGGDDAVLAARYGVDYLFENAY